MWPLLAGLARAGEPLVHLRVTDPTGAVVADEQLALPLEQTFEAQDHALGLWAARFDGRLGVMELVTGRLRGDRPRPKFSRSDELEPFVTLVATIPWKDRGWTVEATYGEVWSAAPPSDGGEACGEAPEGGDVLARTLTAEFPDGTGYTLAAGTPIVFAPDGSATAEAGGLSVRVALADGDLGAPASPVGPRWPRIDDAPQRLEPGVIGHVQGQEVRWTGPLPLPVAARDSVRARVVTVQTACARVRIALPPSEVRR